MVKRLKITILNDNEPGEGLKNLWGWSVLLESEKWRMIFDADSENSVLSYNASQIGINLSPLDFAFLSHCHGDHYGGFPMIASINPGITLYVPTQRCDFLRTHGFRIKVVEEGSKLAPDVWSSGPIGAIQEQALGILVDDVGLVVIVGCSHPGADILTEKLKDITKEKVHLVIGGFHSPPHHVLDNLAKIAEFISPAHCSGQRAKNYTARKYPEKYYPVRTGSVIKIEKREG